MALARGRTRPFEAICHGFSLDLLHAGFTIYTIVSLDTQVRGHRRGDESRLVVVLIHGACFASLIPATTSPQRRQSSFHKPVHRSVWFRLTVRACASPVFFLLFLSFLLRCYDGVNKHAQDFGNKARNEWPMCRGIDRIDGWISQGYEDDDL